ncbi:MAG: IS3 family transposase [Chlamydiae bacterium]|nr:IS3 family transposase [Chlamydiota bacterium]
MVKNKDIFPLEKMAQVLNVARSSYYLPQKPSKRCLENQNILEKAREIYHKSRGTYGSPRIHVSLQRLGIQCSRPRVARLMKKVNLQAKMVKAWKKTTKRNEEHSVEPNHLCQQFDVTEPNKVWVSDITYVPTEEGWLYVSVSLDLFSRKVVGLSMAASLETPLVLNTLDQAFTHRKPGKELMHHSDRGCQYTSKYFKGFMEEYNVKLSMSNKGCCYDNAVAESFFHTLKTEHVDFCKYRTREEAVNSIFEYIEVFYNRQRLHSTLGYYSPAEYEKLWDMKRCSGF